MKKSPDLNTLPRRAFPLDEAGRLLGVSRASLYRQVEEGKLKFIRIGGRTLVPATEIDRIAEEGTM
jgi:excisionase family DNA binding protein